MKQQIRNLGNETVTLRNKAVKQTYLLIHSIQDAVNTAPANTNIDLSKIRIEMNLKQGGQEMTTSFNAIGPAVLGALKMKASGSVSNIGLASGGTTCAGIKINAEDADSYAETFLKIPLLDTAVILKGSDELNITIDLLSGHFSSAVDGSSKVYLVAEEGHDLNQLDMELPYYYPFTTDKQTVSLTFPAISELALIDSGTTYSKESCPFTSVEIISDQMRERYDTAQLYMKQADEYVGIPSENYVNFFVLDANPSCITEVEVNAGVDTSLITANNQFLYVKKVNPNRQLATRAVARKHKVAVRKANFRGLR